MLAMLTDSENDEGELEKKNMRPLPCDTLPVQVGGAGGAKRARDEAEEKYSSKSQRIRQNRESLNMTIQRVKNSPQFGGNIFAKFTGNLEATMKDVQTDPKRQIQTMFANVSYEDIQNMTLRISATHKPHERFKCFAELLLGQVQEELEEVETIRKACEQGCIKIVKLSLIAQFANSNGEMSWEDVQKYLQHLLVCRSKSSNSVAVSTATDDNEDDDDDDELLPDANDGGDDPPKRGRGRPKKSVTVG
eukprot:Skav208680  [mRNA]  locus=scaffold775:305658:306401:- [translate_table: standard]